MILSDQSVVIVTGASTGIGRLSAEALARSGYKVFGTSRKLVTDAPPGVTMLIVDVTDDESVRKMVGSVIEKCGRIDILVNNAGIGLTGAAEESSIAQVRNLFETNFLGVVRVTNAVLPTMRQRRSGRILNLSSGLGFIPAPYSAYYCATKHALEGYSESLDHEIREFGVRVALIEPGATRTAFESSTEMADTPLKAYDASRANYKKAFDRTMATADTAESVAETIVAAARDKRFRVRYPSGKVARQGAFARRFLPRSLFDKVLHKQFGLG